MDWVLFTGMITKTWGIKMCTDNEIIDFLTVQAMLNLEDSTNSKVSAAYIIAKKKFKTLDEEKKLIICEIISEIRVKSKWNDSELFKNNLGENIV